MKVIETRSEEATREIGKILGKVVKEGTVITLNGDLRH